MKPRIVKIIENLLVSNPNISIKELISVIDKLFIDKFGEGIYLSSIHECENMAHQILRDIR